MKPGDDSLPFSKALKEERDSNSVSPKLYTMTPQQSHRDTARYFKLLRETFILIYFWVCSTIKLLMPFNTFRQVSGDCKICINEIVFVENIFGWKDLVGFVFAKIGCRHASLFIVNAK